MLVYSMALRIAAIRVIVAPTEVTGGFSATRASRTVAPSAHPGRALLLTNAMCFLENSAFTWDDFDVQNASGLPGAFEHPSQNISARHRKSGKSGPMFVRDLVECLNWHVSAGEVDLFLRCTEAFWNRTFSQGKINNFGLPFAIFLFFIESY